MSSLKTLAHFMRVYRGTHILTISDLSRLTGISRPYLSQIEEGKIPSKKTIKKLAAGMAADPKQQLLLETEMLELAGFKARPEPIDEDYEEYDRRIRDIMLLESYKEDYQRLTAKVEILESSLNMNGILDPNIKIFFDDIELSENEKIILEFVLLGIRTVRENKSK